MDLSPTLPRGALALALSMAALAAPASASAWDAPVDLSAAGQNAYAPDVASDDTGNSVFTWRRFDGTNDRIETQTRDAAGVLGPLTTLSRPNQDATGQQVDVTPGGDAVFAWLRSDGTNDRVQARSLSAAGVLSNVRTLSPAGADANNARIAVDDQGDATVIWRRSDGTNDRIEAVTITAAGVVGPVRRLSAAGQHALDPELAMNDAGDAVATWFRSDGADDRIQARRVSAAGVVSPVITLSASGGDALGPDVAVDPDGDAYFAWSRFDGTDFRIQSQLVWADGTLGIQHTISDAGGSAHNADIVVDDQGDAVIVYQRHDGTHYNVHGVKMSPADTVGVPETLSDTVQDATIPHVAVDDNGDGVVTWRRFDGADHRVQAATLAFTGQFGAPTTLSDAGEPGNSDAVAVDADGDAVVAWSRSDGTNSRIQYSAGP